jgi:hypothetical protein
MLAALTLGGAGKSHNSIAGTAADPSVDAADPRPTQMLASKVRISVATVLMVSGGVSIAQTSNAISGGKAAVADRSEKARNRRSSSRSRSP